MLFAQVGDKAKEATDAAKDLAEKAKEAAGSLGGDLIKWVIIVVVVVVVLYVVMKVLKGKKKVTGGAGQGIDVMKLPAEGPPAGSPTLEFLNVPVRVSAVIVAPSGRVRDLPPVNQMGDIYDSITPGLAGVIARHKPLVRRWQQQVSAKGFAHTVFQTCRLPGEGGKGSPWCCAAGILKIEGQPVMAALIMRTDAASSHGQQVIDEPEKWLACLRVK